MENQPAGQLRTLLGLKEPNKPNRILVWDTDEISVGRSSENDLVVDDSDVSRCHSVLNRGYEGYKVSDLNTANGTVVNGEAISEPRVLANKDIVKIGELELTFIQTRRDPAALGLEVVYSSQLKDFGSPMHMNSNPEATTLGLLDQADFGLSDGIAPAAPRDLDKELATIRPGEAQFTLEAPPALSGSSSASGTTFSMNVEIKGLTPELKQTLQSLFGKVLDLPALKIRLKDDDF